MTTKVSEVSSVTGVPIVKRDKRPDEEEKDFRKALESCICELENSEGFKALNFELLREDGDLLVQMRSHDGEFSLVLRASEFLERVKLNKSSGLLVDIEC